VYVDTRLICTATALMILCSGTYNVFDTATGEMIHAGAASLGENYVGFTQAAVDSVIPGFGGTFVSIALVFFVFTTVMAYYFYGETSIITLFEGHPERRKAERACIWVFRFVLLGMAVFGTLREAGVIWQLGDVGVGITAWINVIALLILCPRAIRALKEYEEEVR
jgi:AGCS family alanine or glycine:cation symporter